MARSDLCIDQLFRDARTHSAWLDKPVSDETLRELYDALKRGPTSANASPGRFVFIRTAKGKERLGPGQECEGSEQELYPAGDVKEHFLCNLGYRDRGKLLARRQRLEFKESCTPM